MTAVVCLASHHFLEPELIKNNVAVLSENF